MMFPLPVLPGPPAPVVHLHRQTLHLHPIRAHPPYRGYFPSPRDPSRCTISFLPTIFISYSPANFLIFAYTGIGFRVDQPHPYP